ncbi:MAG: T9SS type A sorting domain-containing protein [Ignavibacteriae bacterium]|nr:T9SS type A sorting domain-containing protein [Ignavibacteriota bacterium]
MKKITLLAIFLLSICANIYAQQEPFIYYPFNSNSNDESGNNYNLLNGHAQLTNDRFGNSNSAYSFNGIDDYFERDGGITLNNNITMAVWIKNSGTTNWSMPVCIGNSYFNIRLSFDGTNNKAGFNGWMGGFTGIENSVLTMQNNEWYHLVGVRTGNLWKLYINGTLDSEIFAKPDTHTDLNIAVSKNAYSEYHQDYFKGKIDDIRIYNTALTENEIITLYNENNFQNNGLVASYPFNGNAQDVSGNSLNGIEQGLTYIFNNNNNQAAKFLSSSSVNITDNYLFDFSAVAGFTIEAQFKLLEATNGYILIKMGPGGGEDDEYSLSISPEGQISGACNRNASVYNSVNSIGRLSLNTWYNVIFVWENNGDMSLYIDGVLDNKINSQVTSIQNTNTPIIIGDPNMNAPHSIVGLIDNIRIYNRKLNQSEISELYASNQQNADFIFKYDFETITDNIIIDRSPEGLHNGIIQGEKSIGMSYCTRGSAAYFNGAWRFVVENSKLEDFPLTNDWTLAYSIYLTSQSDGGNGLITRMSSNSGYCGDRGFYIYITPEPENNRFIAAFDDSYIWDAGNNDRVNITGLVNDSWNRVIIVHHSNGYVDLYSNGILVAENQKLFMSETNQKQMSIGGNYLNLHCYGVGFANNIKMDDIALYSGILTNEELLADNLLNPFGFYQNGICNVLPIAQAGEDQVIECGGVDGTEVTLNGSGSTDSDNDSLSFTWYLNEEVVSTEAIANLNLTVGEYNFTLVVDDGNGGTASDDVLIKVEDTTTPVLTLKAPIKIWPVNHKYVNINITDMVNGITDGCSGNLQVNDLRILQVTSDELEDDPSGGDGNTLNDIVINEGCKSVGLRAERLGNADGRVYTVIIGGKDLNGNVGTAEFEVQVPHSKNGTAVKSNVQYLVEGTCEIPLPNEQLAKEVNENREEEIADVIPSNYILNQNYPNPFNPTTKISYSIPENNYVTLIVYDVLGNVVSLLENGYKSAGNYTYNFDASRISNGVYFYKLQAGDFTETKKMILLK